MRSVKAIPAAPGIAIGSAYIIDKQEFIVPPRAILEKDSIEIARFEEALIKTRKRSGLKRKISDEMGGQHAQIFDAHLLALEDRMLIEDVIKKIRQEKQSAEYVFFNVFKKYIKVFDNIKEEYLRERTSDVNDIARRVLKNLIDETKMLHELENLTEELILIAHDLSPSDTVSMFNKNVLAFATDIGGRTSHTAIMAKSLGVPAVVGLKDATLRISNQDTVIVDGRMGLVIVHPAEKTLSIYRAKKEKIFAQRHRFDDIRDLQAETTDGKRVVILANLELPEEIPLILSRGTAGIGLYRTEYFYMNRMDLPTEEEQFEAYRQVAKAIAPMPVTIRTLDLGGDKFISSLQIPRRYPFLGWRAPQILPDASDLKPSCGPSCGPRCTESQMMYPMVSGPSELRQVNAILIWSK